MTGLLAHHSAFGAVGARAGELGVRAGREGPERAVRQGPAAKGAGGRRGPGDLACGGPAACRLPEPKYPLGPAVGRWPTRKRLLAAIRAIGAEGLDPQDYHPAALEQAAALGPSAQLDQVASESFAWLVEDLRDGRTPMERAQAVVRGRSRSRPDADRPGDDEGARQPRHRRHARRARSDASRLRRAQGRAGEDATDAKRAQADPRQHGPLALARRAISAAST